jgi:hypothetical protein
MGVPAALPGPGDSQLVEHELRDRVITGLVSVVPMLALAVAGWRAWEGLLRPGDLVVFGILCVLTGLGPSAPAAQSRAGLRPGRRMTRPRKGRHSAGRDATQPDLRPRRYAQRRVEEDSVAAAMEVACKEPTDHQPRWRNERPEQ